MNTKNNEDTYYAVLKQALSDGVVDNNEWEMLENLRSIFYRMELSEKETRILSSVFAGLSKKG